MKKYVALLLTLTVIAAVFAGCGKNDDTKANVSVLAGPTGIGAVNMWEETANSENGKFIFSLQNAPDEIVAKISKGETDIAAIATNLAAKLYQKTNGGIKILAVNTLGVLNVLQNGGDTVRNFADLKGRKIATTGQGANPEYILNYLFRENGIDPEKDAEITFYADGSELATVWATSPESIIIAPEPVATSILLKYSDAKKVMNLTDEWNRVNPDSALMMGCIVVRTEFLEEHGEIVEEFMNLYEKSVKMANESPKDTAILCEKYGVVPKAAIAEKAIPGSNICYITGDEMKEKLTGYLQVLYDADTTSVGAMPDDNFWYIK